MTSHADPHSAGRERPQQCPGPSLIGWLTDAFTAAAARGGTLDLEVLTRDGRKFHPRVDAVSADIVEAHRLAGFHGDAERRVLKPIAVAIHSTAAAEVLG